MDTHHPSPVSILSLPTLTRYAHGLALAKIQDVWHSDPEVLRLLGETGRVPASYIIDKLSRKKMTEPHRPEAMQMLAAIHPDIQVSREYLDATRRDVVDGRHPNLREVLHATADDVLNQAVNDSMKQILAVMQFSVGVARLNGNGAPS